jgi:predicted phosphodiesterase
MLVVTKDKSASPPLVEWWLSSSRYDVAPPAASLIRAAQAQREGGLWVAELTGLPLDAFVVYRVTTGAKVTEPSVFKSGASRGQPFRFAAFGDTRTNHGVHRAVIDAVAREEVDFFVHTGDMVERGGREPQWELFFRIEAPLMKKAPIFPAIGNHDQSPRDHFGQYFLTARWADSLSYYYQDWGDLRIIAVDAGIECRDGCVQNWFARKALAEGAQQGLLMMLFLHMPPFSSGAHGSYELIQDTIVELTTEYGVELVFTGHDHNYERTKPIRGVTYVVSGAAGAPIRPVKKQHFSEVVRTEPHYVMIDVDRSSLTMRAINLEGETFDTAVIQALPPGGAAVE